MTRVSSRDFFVALLVSFFIIILNFTPVVPFFRSRFLALTHPLQLGFLNLGLSFSSEISFWNHVREISEYNSELEAENVNLKVQLSQLQEVQRENEVLAKELSLVVDASPTLLKAKVQSYGGVETSSLIMIDRGRLDDLQGGEVVVLAGNLVGKIIEVAERTSFVRLLIDDDLKVAALDQDSPDRARGVVRGQFSRLMLMDKILKEERVVEGDKIITSGEDSVFPKGLVIGVVRKVESGPEGLLQKATVESLLKLNRLEEVFIIRPS